MSAGLVRTLLIRAGIEQNPGPTPGAKFYCNVCQKALSHNSSSVQCCKCKNWIHFRKVNNCSNLKSINQYTLTPYIYPSSRSGVALRVKAFRLSECSALARREERERIEREERAHRERREGAQREERGVSSFKDVRRCCFKRCFNERFQNWFYVMSQMRVRR
mgnify:CR=1 FL=1